jgi:membrane protein
MRTDTLALAIGGHVLKLTAMDKRVTLFLGRAKRDMAAILSERPGEHLGNPVYAFLHFWVFVARSFLRNRCPVRATALAYTTLLALVPVLAVGLGVSASLLKSERGQTRQMIEGVIDQLAPQLERLPGSEAEKTEAREQVIEQVESFIGNIRSGALGVTGTIALVLVAIGMLSTIEGAFNDIWGVIRGRSWLSRVIHYWTAITLGPLVVVMAVGMLVSAELLVEPEAERVAAESGAAAGETVVRAAHGDDAAVEGGMMSEFWSGAVRSLRMLAQSWIGRGVLNLLPFVVLTVCFGVLYQLMPNTRVGWQAALVGGLVGALLWILNSKLSVLFASRVVAASKVYGPLGVFPVFLIGIYVSWLILLFGAQVAYAFQNRRAHLLEKRFENVNQRGRELGALRIMVTVGDRFDRGENPPTAVELADELGVSPRLIAQLIEPLCNRNLVVEVNAPSPGYSPGRPLDRIGMDQILEAMRSGGAEELEMKSGGGDESLLAAYVAVHEAETQAAGSMNLRRLVDRAKGSNARLEGDG